MESFQYKPEVDYSLVSAENSQVVVKYLGDFKKGILSPLEGHLLTAEGLRKYINSVEVSNEIRAEYRSKNKELEDTLTAITRTYSNIETELNVRQLETIASREYFKYFNDPSVDGKKLEFIKLLKTYEFLKIANLTFIEHWDTIIRIFKAISVNSVNKAFLEQVLSFRAFPRKEACDLTSLFLRRLAYVLKIHKEENKFGKINATGFYTSQIDYKYTAVFREDLEKILSAINPQSQRKEKETSHKNIDVTCFTDSHHVDSSGDEPFNQGYAYILQTDEKKLESDEKKIQKAIYLETHLGAEAGALRQDLIRRFISHAQEHDRIKEYDDFLTGYFKFIRETIFIQFLDFSEKEKILLLYHFGIVFFLKIAVHYMREAKTGFVHRHFSRQKMLRELPFEFVKHSLMNWWNAQVFQKLTAGERNNAEMYYDMIESIKQLWFQNRTPIIEKVKNDVFLLRAYNFHDVAALAPFLEHELSYIVHVFFSRFLGHDYLFLPPNKIARRPQG